MMGRESWGVHVPEESIGAVVPIVDVLRGVGDLAASTGRTDLAERLEQTRSRLRDPGVRVIVVGEFKQGKSKLINALVSAPVCPVDDDVATSVPMSVGYADQAAAWVLQRQEAEGRRSAKPAVDRVPIALDDLPRYVSEHGNPANERGIVSAEVVLPREILRGGLQLIDSPGVGGLDSANALATLHHMMQQALVEGEPADGVERDVLADRLAASTVRGALAHDERAEMRAAEIVDGDELTCLERM